VERARKALRGDDMSEIGAANEELTKAYQEAGQSFYAQSQAAPEPTASDATGTGEATGGAPKGDEVAEADYEIVDDTKK
jgi:molecular chaperone DnaK